jgi:hypothetical protein
MTNENQIILRFPLKLYDKREPNYLWFPIKLYDKREPNYFVIPNEIIWQTRTKLFCDSQENYMTNENQIIWWFLIKLYDKREPNYFVISQ